MSGSRREVLPVACGAFQGLTICRLSPPFIANPFTPFYEKLSVASLEIGTLRYPISFRFPMLKKLTFLLITLLICTSALKSIASAEVSVIEQIPILKQTDARQETLEHFIIRKMSKHFTMNGEDASFVLEYGGGNKNPTVFEMKGFRMKPQISRVTNADQLNGVDLKFTLQISSKFYRQGTLKTRIFDDWKDGTPANAYFGANFNFERRDGLFRFRPTSGANFCVSKSNYQLGRK